MDLPCVGKMSEEYIRGVGKVAEKLVVLLNIDKILSEEEKTELDKVEQINEHAEAAV